MNVVPDELAAAVHRAASATTAYDSDLDRIRRRWRSRRRRRLAVTAGATACLVAAGVVGVPALAGHFSGGAGDTTASAREPVPPQRLLVGRAGWQSGDFYLANIIRGQSIGEIDPDGGITYHRIPMGWNEGLPLPDGRIVGIRRSDTPAGLAPGERLTVNLMVLRADGSTELDRSLVADPETALVGVTADTAYLLRKAGILAHDLATGRESPVPALRAAGIDPADAPRGDIEAGLLAVPDKEGAGCTIRLLNLADERPRTPLRIEDNCAATVRLSPDGRLLAALYGRQRSEQAAPDHRLTILDVATGAVRADVPLRSGAPISAPGGWTMVPVLGLAWIDTDTVLAALWSGKHGTPDDSFEAGIETMTVTATAR